MNQKLKFIGRNKSCGFVNGRAYSVTIEEGWGGGFFSYGIRLRLTVLNGSTEPVIYESWEALWENWEPVRRNSQWYEQELETGLYAKETLKKV